MTNEQIAKEALEIFKLKDTDNEDISGFEEGYLQCLKDNPVLGNLLQITWLSANHLSLDHYRYLEAFGREEEVSNNKWTRHLEKHGFVFNHEISEKGKEILQIVPHLKGAITIIKEKPKKKEYDENFLRWWNNFPATANIKGFESTRSLRNKQSECETMFLGLLKEGKYDTDQLIKAVNTEVEMRKRESERKNKNQLEFMNATSAYLNQRKFELYLNSSFDSKPKKNIFNTTI